MKLDAEQRAFVHELMSEADAEARNPLGGVDSSLRGDLFTAKMLDAERYGQAWVSDYNRWLHRQGAKSMIDAWDRSQRIVATGPQGQRANLPRNVGTTRRDDEGRIVHERHDQLSLGLEYVEQQLERIYKTIGHESGKAAFLEPCADAIRDGRASSIGEAANLLGIDVGLVLEALA